MSNEDEKEVTNSELLESINRGFSRIEEKMATKEDLKSFATKEDLEAFKLETNIHFKNIETELSGTKSELKSFKTETRESFAELSEKMDDLTEVMMSNHDKRIEVLEEKAL